MTEREPLDRIIRLQTIKGFLEQCLKESQTFTFESRKRPNYPRTDLIPGVTSLESVMGSLEQPDIDYLMDLLKNKYIERIQSESRQHVYEYWVNNIPVYGPEPQIPNKIQVIPTSGYKRLHGRLKFHSK